MSTSVVEIQRMLEELPQDACPVKHYFSDGAYAREIFLPKGILIAGALHKTNHMYVVSQGRLFVQTGSKKMIITAPYHGYTHKGDKRIIYAFEDSLFTTFHVTDLTDPDMIAKSILAEEL